VVSTTPTLDNKVKRMWRPQQSTLWLLLFLGPPLILFTVMVVIPTVMALSASFTDANLLTNESNWVGLENFRDAFSDTHVLHSIRITLIWTVFAAIIPPAFGLGIAMMFQDTSRFATAMKSALFVPIALSLVAVGQVWIWIYQPGDGLINTVLGSIGLENLEQAWLSNRSTALAAVFVAWAWQQIVLAMILYLAGLSAIPTELIEAAHVDGATKAQVFRRVTLPLLRPVTTVVLSLIAINSLRNFDLVFAMTSGGPVRETETMPLLVFRILFRELQEGSAAAISIILFAMTLIVVGGLTWWGRRGSDVA
jgi:ABC-type sugar transport system permease subunit